MSTQKSKLPSSDYEQPGSGQRPVARYRSVQNTLSNSEQLESEPAGFSGTCENMSLADLIQLVQMGRRDAVIGIKRHDGKKALLWCHEGDIVDAWCEGVVAEDAVYRALGWEGGRVSVAFAPVERRRRIHMATSALLLHAAYQKDSVVRELRPPPAKSDVTTGSTSFRASSGTPTSVASRSLSNASLPSAEDAASASLPSVESADGTPLPSAKAATSKPSPASQGTASTGAAAARDPASAPVATSRPEPSVVLPHRPLGATWREIGGSRAAKAAATTMSPAALEPPVVITPEAPAEIEPAPATQSSPEAVQPSAPASAAAPIASAPLSSAAPVVTALGALTWPDTGTLVRRQRLPKQAWLAAIALLVSPFVGLLASWMVGHSETPLEPPAAKVVAHVEPARAELPAKPQEQPAATREDLARAALIPIPVAELPISPGKESAPPPAFVPRVRTSSLAAKRAAASAAAAPVAPAAPAASPKATTSKPKSATGEERSPRIQIIDEHAAKIEVIE